MGDTDPRLQPEKDDPAAALTPFDDWRGTLGDLLQAYQRIQQRALALPAVIWGGFWVRPQDMRVSGEITWFVLAPRAVVDYVLGQHVSSRLRLVRRCLLLDDRLSPDQQDCLVNQIDRLLPVWPRRPALTLVYTYLLPAAGVLPVVASFLQRRALPGGEQFVSHPFSAWRYIPVILALVYGAIIWLLPCFVYVVKRGLMLGGQDASTVVPPLLKGQGAYGVEAHLFGRLAPLRHELPLDLIFFGMAWLLEAAIGVDLLTRIRRTPLLVSLFTVAFLVDIVGLALVVPALTFRQRRRLRRW